ncbi:MAG TPA: DUF3089 domain-containing protein [Rhizomicrobium sp.]|nr:DUF3089 domain-containing protein [Rhizomicrobium sp.]
MRKLAAALIVAAATLPALADDAPTATMPKNDYARADNWLCLPGHEDACASDQDTTVVKANGTLTAEKFHPAKNPPIDCFYVYPTVSRDRGVVSDMDAGPEELGVVAQQFARFADVCKTYAPLYRQYTLTSLFARQTGKPMALPPDPAVGYHDVVDAWNYYLANYNHGRGVVLIGHSQGSGVLTRLIKEEIDPKPVRKQLVVAILGGTRLGVPAGKDAGGDFQNVPLCHDAKTPGCVIAFASFRANSPPPPDTLFGKVATAGWEAACVNPAALGGGSGDVHAYLTAYRANIAGSDAPQPAWATGKTVDTPFVSVPGLLTAQCGRNENGTYLGITVHGDPADPRTDDIPGDVAIGGNVLKQWGLHLIDMNLFMGNFQDIVRSETRAYLKEHH